MPAASAILLNWRMYAGPPLGPLPPYSFSICTPMTGPPSFQSSPLNLLPDLLVEIIDETKEARVGGSLRALFHHPIRKAAVARLSMYPWPDAHV